MKTKSLGGLGSTHGLAFMLSFVVTIGLGWSSTRLEDQPCDTTSTGYNTTEEVCGESSHSNEFLASTLAMIERDDKLGQQSGVICSFCPNEVRCYRIGIPTQATTIVCEFKNGSWTCTSCATGTYDVTCRECPTGGPDPPE